MDPLAIVRAIATLGEAIIVGTGVLLWYTRDALEPAGALLWRRRAALTVLIVSFVGAVATSIGAVGAAAAAAGTPFFSVSIATIETFLFKTGVGRFTVFEMACAWLACLPAALALAWINLKKSSLSNLALLMAAGYAGLGLAAFPFNSHPVTLDQLVTGIVASVAHRLALAVWAGGLPALILLIGAGSIPDDTRRLATVVLRRFSRLASVAMAVLLVTGVLLTYFLVGNVPGMIGTEYGRLLCLKLALLGGVLYIASGLQRQLLPMLELRPVDRTFRRYANRVKIETVLAVLIIVVASDLAGLAPPEHENIVWPLPFRFSFAATWSWAFVPPWIAIRFIGGNLLALLGLAVVALSFFPVSRLAWLRLPKKWSIGAGTLAVAAGAGIALPAVSVQAYPDTYLTTDIPYAARSIANGIKTYEDNCTGCHGVSGHGDGPLAADLPIKPADLSAPHTALHTAGDLYWWVTHGIENSPMPAFGDVLSDDTRWDVINFLAGYSNGYLARIIEPRVQPGQYWLAPPDFEFTDENGQTGLLTDYRTKSAVLVVLFSCAPENLERETARFDQILADRDGLAEKSAKILLIAPGDLCAPLREKAAGKILLVNRDIEDAAATLGLFTRSFHNRQQLVVRVPPVHAEFLIDRAGYIRSRWLPAEDDSWADPRFIEGQLDLLAREPREPPPPGPHDHG